tara:strand:- start:1345 stop:1521 length:177 start_codon:yes stop_codon:yes gene_type:complete
MTSDKRLKLYDNYTELLEQIMEIDMTYKGQTKEWLIDEDTLDRFNVCRDKLKKFWRAG